MKFRNSAILLGMFFFSFIFLLQAHPSYAWLSGFNYRRNITINNTANKNTLTDYQVAINLTYSSNMQPDFSDIRFTDTSDSLLSYWIENQSNSQWAYVWVKVPNIPASSYVTIYVYYGNTTPVSSASNGTNTFDFYVYNDVGYSQFSGFKSGVGYYEYNTTELASHVTNDGATGGSDRADLNTTTAKYSGSGIRIKTRTKWIRGSASTYNELDFGFCQDCANINLLPRDNSNWFGFYYDGWYQHWYFTSKNSGSGSSTTLDANYVNNAYIDLEIRGGNSTGYLKVIKYNSTYPYPNGYVMATITSNIPSVNLYGVIDANSNYPANSGTRSRTDMFVTYYIIAKYTDPEPTYSIGAEEIANQPPQYSNVLVSPLSPQDYETTNIWFNITWNDTDGTIDKAWIVHNFTGIQQTYLMQNTTPITPKTAINFYYKLDFIPAAGTYSYTFYANDTLGATNQTQTFTYVINKKQITIYLAINGTQDNVTYTYPAVTNTTGWKDSTLYSEGTLTLLRNGTQAAQSTNGIVSEIIQLAAGTYNYTLTFDHQNYTASPVTRILTINKANSQLSLIAFPSWEVNEGTEINISCSAVSPLTVKLTKDNVQVSNPYIARLPFGLYKFYCEISDQQNYTPVSISNYLNVITKGFGCTDNSTFAFSLTVQTITFPINLNFTNLVNQSLVKADLSDIWVNSSIVTANKNTTNGYYLIVTNSTPISSFEVKFGNYYVSNSYSNAKLAATTINVENYTEHAPYYVFYFLNEKTGQNLVPPQANNTLQIFCANGVTALNISQPKMLVATFQQLDSIRTIVAYSTTEIYYRDYFLTSPIEHKYVYLVDANQDQVLQMIFKIQDLTRNFPIGSKFIVKKYLGGELKNIDETKLDAEYKTIVFLMNGYKYQIYLNNGNEERNIGEIYPDPSNLEKTIVVADYKFTNSTLYNITYGFDYNPDIGVISFYYEDPTAETEQVEFFVYNATSEEQLYYASSSNTSKVNFNYVVPEKNQTYLAKFLAHYKYFGNHTFGFSQYLGGLISIISNPPSMPLINLIQELGGAGITWFLLIFIAPISLMFTERTAGIGIFFLIGIFALLWYLKVISFAGLAIVIGICLLIGILAEIHIRRREMR
jgi:hypothetical protein